MKPTSSLVSLDDDALRSDLGEDVSVQLGGLVSDACRIEGQCETGIGLLHRLQEEVELQHAPLRHRTLQNHRNTTRSAI